MALMLRDGGHSALKTRVRALGRLLSMRGITILGVMEERAENGVRMAKRVHDRASGRSCKAGLWLFPVFVPFRPVIGGKARRPKKRRLRGFPVCIPPLTGNAKHQVVAGPLFLACYLQGKTGAAGVAFARCRSRRGSLPHAVSAGARLRE